MSRVQKICKWCGHKITFDKDKYIQQGRADERAELLDKVANSIHQKMCSENCGERQCVDAMDRCVWYGYVNEVIAEMKSEIEE